MTVATNGPHMLRTSSCPLKGRKTASKLIFPKYHASCLQTPFQGVYYYDYPPPLSLEDSGRGAGFWNTRAEPRDLVMYVSRCRQRKVCHVRESGTSYLSELVFVSLFVRQSSTNLQAVQTAQNITQENIASKYYSFQLIICHKVQLF